MTVTTTLTHTEATKLLHELQTALQNRNLDTLQMVVTGKDIHVVKLNIEHEDEHPNNAQGH